MLKRLRYWFRVKVSHILDRVEDPEDALDYTYTLQLETLLGLKQDAVRLLRAKNRLEDQLIAIRESAQGSEERASLLIAAGDIDMARLVLQQKYIGMEDASALTRQIAEIEQEAEPRLYLLPPHCSWTNTATQFQQ